MQLYSFRKWGQSRLHCSVLLCAGLLLVLAACGSVATTGGPTTPTAVPQLKQCGRISSVGKQHVLQPDQQKVAQQAEECFLQAFQHCQPATLQYLQAGIDAGVVHNFRISQQPGKCVVIDAAQHYIAPQPPRAATTYTCASVMQQAGQYIVSACGSEGNIVLPSPQFTSP